MKYINLNDYFLQIKKPKQYSIEEVLFTGQAPDKGLFAPETFVHYDKTLIKYMKGERYADVAFRILYPYFDDIPEKDFEAIVHKVYGKIKAPVRELYQNIYILELFHNWTFAFKDFAAQLLAGVIEYFLKKTNKRIVVFVGTSGDTGPAINEAFWKKKNIKVYCLFPKKGVTPIQRKQMTTLGENIFNIEVDGDFHACQEMAKAALNDDYMKYFNPTSANSINWGRFIPQEVFSFWFYSKIAEYPEPVIFSIPTGNAGHIGANFLAQKDIGGLPVARFIAPHNLNNYMVRMLKNMKKQVAVTRTYNCLSNAMNVKQPNNIPRILYIFDNDMDKMQKLIYPVTISDKRTADIMRQVYKDQNYLLDVHSAVSMAGVFDFLERHPKYRDYKIGAFLTAEPAKFPEKIKSIMGFEPPIPEKLKKQLAAPEKNVFSLKANDLKGLQEIVYNTRKSS
ncbi:MAG: threonine synthase [bacterium]|nr:threonine synthase [bacterium]